MACIWIFTNCFLLDYYSFHSSCFVSIIVFFWLLFCQFTYYSLFRFQSYSVVNKWQVHSPMDQLSCHFWTWVLTPFPQDSFGLEFKPRCSLCTHAFHHTDSKDPDICVLDGWMLATKHNQLARFTKREHDYLYGWMIKTVTYAKISPRMVNPRYIAAITEGDEEECEAYSS